MKKMERDYYQSLYEVAAILNSQRDPRALLRAIVEYVAKTTGHKACSLMLLTPDREALLHTAAYGLSSWYLRKGPVRVGKVISEVLEGKPVAILEASTDERVLYREQAKQEGIASILSVPVRLRGEIIGVMRVYTAEPYRFTEDDIHFVETIANLGAVALENLRAYDIIQKDYDTFRREMLQWRAELGDEWVMGDLVVPPEEQEIRMPPGG
ncbi:MAG: GAF domain-containing protein [Dehalococcoidia bacterium]|nr:GAF domain-containing protein [Dehalococcoidia bacterium]